MSEVLGTARILLTVDTTEYEARIARSKNLAHGLGAEAEAAFGKSDARAKRAASSLLRYAETVGKSADEQKLLNAAMAGVPLSVIEASAQKINNQRLSIESATRAARELEATRAFERQAQEAAKLVQATSYVRWWEDALEQVEAQEAKMAANKQFIRSLEQQALAIGKTRAEILELRAAEMGLSAEAAPFIAKLKQQEAALQSGSIAFNQYGLSAKQTQAALRQVPAQLTDIFVSLQGGQAPLTVLLQQGGQLRDIFGGIRPAFAALGNALLGLVNPLTLTAGAGIAVAAAFFKGQQEAVEFEKALTLSGNRIGQTADSLSRLANRMDDVSGVTQSSAAAAITAVAASGRIAAENFELVAEASIAMQRATGKAVEDTVKEFAEIGKSPVEAILRLNEAQNFLTDTVFQQIRAAEEQGRTQDAARIATEAYADALIERGNEVRENLGLLEGAWKAVSGVAKEAWDSMLDIGRESTMEEQLRSLEQQARLLEEQAARGGLSGNSVVARWRRQRLEENLAEQKRLRETMAKEESDAARQAAEQVLNAELIALDQAARKYETEADKKARERREIQVTADRAYAQAIELGNTELAKQVRERERLTLAAFDEKNKDRKGGSSALTLANAAARNQLEEVKALLEQERAVIANSTKILEAEFDARLIPAEQYYSRMRELTQQDQAAQERALLKQIELLRARDVDGKTSLDVQQQLIRLEAELAKVRADGATAITLLSVKEQAANEKREESLRRYTEALGLANDALRKKIEAEISAIGMGDEQARRQAELSAIYAEQAEKLEELNRQLRAGELTPEEYEQYRDELQDHTDEKVEIVKGGFERMDEAKGNWLNGLRAGIENWMDEAADVASQVEQITTNAFDRMADAITDAAITGKFEWRDMLADILKQIIAFLAKQAVLKFLEVMKGGSTTGTTTTDGGGGWGAIFSAIAGAFTGFAKGGVHESPSLSQYSGKVYDSPQFFKFAKGAGVFGEAGPEAIMPLRRGPDGNLGVRMFGGAPAQVNVTIATTINSDGTSTTTTERNSAASDYDRFVNGMRAVAQEEINKAMRPGGSLYKVGVNVR